MRWRKIRGLLLRTLLMYAWLALALFSGGEPSRAQERGVPSLLPRPDLKTQGKKREAAAPSKPETRPADEPARLRAILVQAGDEYKSSLEQLLALYQANAKRGEEWLAKIKALSEQGVVTRPEVERAENAAARAREQVAEAQAQLKSAEVQIAEALVEAEAEESRPKLRLSSAPRAVGGLVQMTAYVRYVGGRAWSLSEAATIEQFFRARFGRALPVSAFGQSPLHDHWGYDHHNAMDVPLSPDSAEGRALTEFLSASGIPFTAFRSAIPGSATGPHVHIGLPSHRVAPR